MINEKEYREYIESLKDAQIVEKIADLDREIQGNAEMSESAHYYRYEQIVWPSGRVEMPNQFLADWEDYEHEVEECEKCKKICESVLNDRRNKE